MAKKKKKLTKKQIQQENKALQRARMKIRKTRGLNHSDERVKRRKAWEEASRKAVAKRTELDHKFNVELCKLVDKGQSFDEARSRVWVKLGSQIKKSQLAELECKFLHGRIGLL